MQREGGIPTKDSIVLGGSWSTWQKEVSMIKDKSKSKEAYTLYIISGHESCTAMA